MSDYRKYLLCQMGLKESQFVPFVREDEHPDIDPLELQRGADEEENEHGMSPEKALKTAKDHLKEPGQAHYYSGMEKAKKDGMLKDNMMSPTAIATPIIAVGIRGSYTGGLPSGADQGQGPDLAPNKLGGYDRVQPEMLNSKLIDKTPKNPEIGQGSQPIISNPSTDNGITHPHQIQVTAGEEPQSTTGASTDSDPTLKLKSGMPKGIDIDITEKEAEPSKEEENPMIPATSLSEVFARHKKLMYEKIGACSCGHMKKECDCKPECKCGCNAKIEECSTCGCDDSNNIHSMNEEIPAPGQSDDYYAADRLKNSPKSKFDAEMYKQKVEPVAAAMIKGWQGESPKYIPPSGGAGLNEADKNSRICYHCKQPHPCKCDEKDYEDAKLSRDNPEDYRKRFGMKVDKRNDLYESYAPPFSRMRGLAGIGNIVLTNNGLWESKTHQPAEDFNTHWKMDKEKAGFVKIDEAKLNHIKAQLEKKSKRGTLSDKELLLTKRIGEALKKRNALDKQSQSVDKRFAKMEKDPTDRPFPFDKDHTGPMRHGNDKGQLPAR